MTRMPVEEQNAPQCKHVLLKSHVMTAGDSEHDTDRPDDVLADTVRDVLHEMVAAGGEREGKAADKPQGDDARHPSAEHVPPVMISMMSGVEAMTAAHELQFSILQAWTRLPPVAALVCQNAAVYNMMIDAFLRDQAGCAERRNR